MDAIIYAVPDEDREPEKSKRSFDVYVRKLAGERMCYYNAGVICLFTRLSITVGFFVCPKTDETERRLSLYLFFLCFFYCLFPREPGSRKSSDSLLFLKLAYYLMNAVVHRLMLLEHCDYRKKINKRKRGEFFYEMLLLW